MYSLRSFNLIQSLLLWILFIVDRAKVVLLKQLLKICQRLTQTIQKYILGDFNINLFSKQKYIFHQTNIRSMSPEVKNYFQFCSLYVLEQLIKSPTRVTCSTSSLIDHILTTFPERLSQQGIIGVGLPDHQLIYCTRNFSHAKVGTQKQTAFHSLKNYTVKVYKEALGKVYFPNYENFGDVNIAYENFIQKLMSIIDKLAPFKTKRVKDNSQ